MLANNPVTDALLESVGGLLAILDENRQILAVNHAFLETLGYSIDPDTPKLAGEARRDVVVRTGEDGSLVRLHDLARISLDATDYSRSSRKNGRPIAMIGKENQRLNRTVVLPRRPGRTSPRRPSSCPRSCRAPMGS